MRQSSTPVINCCNDEAEIVRMSSESFGRDVDLGTWVKSKTASAKKPSTRSIPFSTYISFCANFGKISKSFILASGKQQIKHINDNVDIPDSASEVKACCFARNSGVILPEDVIETWEPSCAAP